MGKVGTKGSGEKSKQKRKKYAEEYQNRKWDNLMANLNFSKFFQEGGIKSTGAERGKMRGI